jgi:hypothetical protein
MDEDAKRPPNSGEPRKPEARPSDQRVLENLERWANSPGLQPPK